MTQSQSPGTVVLSARVSRNGRDAFRQKFGQQGTSKALSCMIDLVVASECRDLDDLAMRLGLAPRRRPVTDARDGHLRLVTSRKNVLPFEAAQDG